ncbi:hypothetical protein [Nostoc sp.]|uniref:hypothetical protein n=1 Tax=Nostoc sp. TaxID=1180 RepID=UPI002FF479CA
MKNFILHYFMAGYPCSQLAFRGRRNLGLSVTSPPLWGLAGSIPAPALINFDLSYRRGAIAFRVSISYKARNVDYCLKPLHT